MKKDNCKICGEENKTDLCKRCSYLLKNGASEGTIKKMLSDTKTNEIWNKNKEIANRLAYAYYDSLLKTYNRNTMKNDSKKNFGFNTFAEGINLSLDIIMPLLDYTHFRKAKDKIETMLKIREKENQK